MNTNEIPTVEQTVERAKREILADIGTAVSSRGDVMPATVSTFSELHDYVDANTYGGMCDDVYDAMCGDDESDSANDAWTDHCNAVTDALDEWLRAGRPGLIVTTFDGEPVVGERVTYRTVGPSFIATGSGVYEGVRPSEHDGAPYHYLRDGEINGTPQTLHGFPVDRVGR